MFSFPLNANIVFNQIKYIHIHMMYIYICVLWMYKVHPCVDSYVFAFDAANACPPFAYKSV